MAKQVDRKKSAVTSKSNSSIGNNNETPLNIDDMVIPAAKTGATFEELLKKSLMEE